MAVFDYFVVMADRRTGSNFLEANLNALSGVTCHGELFNPAFVGFPKQPETFGMTLDARNSDPWALVEKVKRSDGLNGFRYFEGHEPRVLDQLLDDPRCGKILLSRNPLDSFISLEIARTTKQWKLTDESRRKFEPITFNPAKFDRYASTVEAYQARIMSSVRTAGQAIFSLDYDNLRDVDVINRLAAFLGVDDRLDRLDGSVKKQNPEPISTKVTNFEEMMEALALRDPSDLGRPAQSEARRGPSVHTYLATPHSGLMYQVLRSGPTSAVSDWMADLDGVRYRDLRRDFTLKSLHAWRQNTRDHRLFTVLRHPVARAHSAFCDKILATGKGSYPDIRDTLQKSFGLELPDTIPDAAYEAAAHRAAFLLFLKFLKDNLAGRTRIRIDPHWASQANTVLGFSEVAPPDLILREDRLEDDLIILASQMGKQTMPPIKPTDPHANRLAEIYDAEIEAAVMDVYQRDYDAFGFGAYTT